MSTISLSGLLNNTYQGEIGFTGSQGDIGFTGSQGFTGSKGDSADVAITDDITTNSSRFITFVEQTSGDVAGFGVSSSKLFYNPATGTLNATEFNSLSDITFKENIQDISDAINIIESLRGVEFSWKETNETSYGLIAQELEMVLPKLVAGTDIKSVNYSGTIPFLIESIKYLKKELDLLKSESNE
jgi:trimeric autotransporter adhesin